MARTALVEIVLDIRRRRAARLGLPEPEDLPDPEFPPGMPLAEIILASRQRVRERRAAEE